jgi:hypothetical protein
VRAPVAAADAGSSTELMPFSTGQPTIEIECERCLHFLLFRVFRKCPEAGRLAFQQIDYEEQANRSRGACQTKSWKKGSMGYRCYVALGTKTCQRWWIAGS